MESTFRVNSEWTPITCTTTLTPSIILSMKPPRASEKGEFVIQALSNVGGDFHAGNMQGRILTQFA